MKVKNKQNIHRKIKFRILLVDLILFITKNYFMLFNKDLKNNYQKISSFKKIQQSEKDAIACTAPV